MSVNRYDAPTGVKREDAMGLDDKVRNEAEDVKGKLKEGAGKATDDERLEAEGKGDQFKSDLKQAGEEVKDAGGKVKDAFRD